MDDHHTSTIATSMQDDVPRLLSLEEARTALNISRWSLYQLINSGRLKSLHIESRRLIALADLKDLINELREEGGK